MSAIPGTNAQGRPEALPRLLGLRHGFIMLRTCELDLVVVGSGKTHDGAEIDEGRGGLGGVEKRGREKKQSQMMNE